MIHMSHDDLAHLVRQEIEACAKIAEAEAERLAKYGAHSAEVASRIAALIRARGIQ